MVWSQKFRLTPAPLLFSKIVKTPAGVHSDTPAPDSCTPEVAGVTFSDSGYNHQSNLDLPMFLLKKWPHRLLLLLKLKSDSGSGFTQIFDSGSWSGSEGKTQNPAGGDSGYHVRSHLCYRRHAENVCFVIGDLALQPVGPPFSVWYGLIMHFCDSNHEITRMQQEEIQ